MENLDLRPQDAQPTAAQQAALASLRSRLPGLEVQFDPLTGSPSHILAAGRFLSAAPEPGGDPVAPVGDFLSRNSGLFGYDGDLLGQARLTREDVTAHNGLRTLVWQQELDGIPVYQAVLKANLTKDGRIVTLGSQFVPAPEKASELSPSERKELVERSPLTARQAISVAAGKLGDQVAADSLQGVGEPRGAERRQRFEAAGLSDTQAGLTWLPMSATKLRLAWDVTLMSLRRGEMFRMVVDVKSGEVLIRTSQTADISNANYRVYANPTTRQPLDSPTPLSPGYTTPLTSQPQLATRNLLTLSALDTGASPDGWIADGVLQTTGNNVDAHLDLANVNPGYSSGTHATSATRNFDFTLDLSQAPSSYRSASLTQLFYAANWFHDRLYQLGFTETAGNFQQNNFNRGGTGGDAVLADAQDGGSLNNANFSTPSDGSAGRLQVYIFNGPNPDRDGALDNEVVLHELTHGVSNRLVGGGVGISSLQSRGLGEGWSDFYALSLLSDPADAVGGNYAMGGYVTYKLSGVTTNYYFGVRRYPYSTDLTKNPLTLKDIDPFDASAHANISLSPLFLSSNSDPSEVHNMGEVWCVALWEARANLIAKLGAAAGNEMMLRLATDGLKLTPANPTFIQARDAIIQADLVDNNASNRAELWSAFAKRGFGANASVPANNSTTGVVESFDFQDELLVTPSNGFSAAGWAGGPFTPAGGAFTLTNLSTSRPISWSATASAGWIVLPSAGGTLAPGASTSVNVSFSPAANSLSGGNYHGTVSFTNLTGSYTQTRDVQLLVRGQDYFTETFGGASVNDTSYQSWLFTPDNSSGFYSVRRSTILALPADPSGGNELALTDDDSAYLYLQDGAHVSLYGTSYSGFYVGSNGYLTFGAPDNARDGTANLHFAIPRVAGLFIDLDPTGGGTVSWRQLSNRIAVTYSGVPNYEEGNANTFQIEMFFDGRIRISCLQISSAAGLIGLAQGTGVPSDFLDSDLTAYTPKGLNLTVPETIADTPGVLLGKGAVTLSRVQTSAVSVSLVSSVPSRLSVPPIVVIGAGSLSALFDLSLLDSSVQGGQNVTLLATATGFESSSADIEIAFFPPVLSSVPPITGGATRTLSWTAVSGADSYEAQASLDGFVTFASSGSVAGTSYTFTGLIDGAVYSYRVRARRAQNSFTVAVSDWSPLVVSTQDSSPPQFELSEPQALQSQRATLIVEGSATDRSGVQSVIVGGIPADTSDGLAHWIVTVTGLHAGHNLIPIEIRDGASPPNITSGTIAIEGVLPVDLNANGIADYWEASYGVAPDPQGTFAQSGVQNLLAYAFGLDPFAVDRSLLPSASVEIDQDNDLPYLTFSYRRRLDDFGLTYHVLLSHDLEHWAPADDALEEYFPPYPNSDEETETVTLRLKEPIGPDSGNAYLRLEIVGGR